MRLLTLRLTCVAFLAFSSAHAATFPSAFEPLRMSVDEGLVFSGSGGIFIVYGSPDLVSMPFTSDTITNVGGSYIPGLNQISAVVDFNGDGIDDLLLGSPDGYFYEIVTIDANGRRPHPPRHSPTALTQWSFSGPA